MVDRCSKAAHSARAQSFVLGRGPNGVKDAGPGIKGHRLEARVLQGASSGQENDGWEGP